MTCLYKMLKVVGFTAPLTRSYNCHLS